MHKVSFRRTIGRPAVTISCLLLAGLLLRLFFVLRHNFIAGDSLLYQEISLNWRQFHVYGLSTDTVPRSTLIRLPGYPAVLAVLGSIFDRFLQADPGTLRSFMPVLFLQIAADLVTALLLASLAGRLFGRRAATAALAMACLCPFLANYTAVPLTETFTVFTIAAAFWSAQRWREAAQARSLLMLAASLSFSILLRPDQALLFLAVLPLVPNHGTAGVLKRWKPALVCTALVALPFLVWTARNASTFHVFQPLAPRLANDPGEEVPRGFQRWYRTVGVDFDSTQEAYWKYPEEPVSPNDLPRRAFDNPAQEGTTRDLLHEAAAFNRLRPEIDARFAKLADERIAAAPVRYYVLLPFARLANMLLRPRVEMLPIEERWWQYRRHPAQTIFATFYGALGAAYLVVGVAGFFRARRIAPAITLSLAAFVLLRCLLLLTLDNAEQRYTIEFFPVWIVLGSAWWGHETGGNSMKSPEMKTI